jgi:hypothetical protein
MTESLKRADVRRPPLSIRPPLLGEYLEDFFDELECAPYSLQVGVRREKVRSNKNNRMRE